MSGPPSVHERPRPGAVLGDRFRVLSQIGEGGMGVVLEAQNLVTGKRVAIKWMQRKAPALEAERIERFLREARSAARIRHPNVVDIYDVVQDGDTLFMVMELLEGEPLSALLERGGISDHELIALLLDAMRGVSAAHNQRVIHRDIKPDNIFLAREEDRSRCTPIVVDFGVSKLIDADAQSLTNSNATLGTPLYMSNEQLTASAKVDERTDIYAFGVILYEAMTGVHPFEADNLPELVFKILSTEPEPPRRVREEIPDALERTILKAMAKEREQRHPTLAALIAELEPFAHAAAFAAGQPEDPPEPRAQRRSRLRWLLPAMLALTVVGAVALRGLEPDEPVVRPATSSLERPEIDVTRTNEVVAVPVTDAPAPAPPPASTEPAPSAAPAAAGPKRTKPRRAQKAASPAPAEAAASPVTAPAAEPVARSTTETDPSLPPLRAGRPTHSDFE